MPSAPPALEAFLKALAVEDRDPDAALTTVQTQATQWASVHPGPILKAWLSTRQAWWSDGPMWEALKKAGWDPAAASAAFPPGPTHPVTRFAAGAGMHGRLTRLLEACAAPAVEGWCRSEQPLNPFDLAFFDQALAAGTPASPDAVAAALAVPDVGRWQALARHGRVSPEDPSPRHPGLSLFEASVLREPSGDLADWPDAGELIRKPRAGQPCAHALVIHIQALAAQSRRWNTQGWGPRIPQLVGLEPDWHAPDARGEPLLQHLRALMESPRPEWGEGWGDAWQKAQGQARAQQLEAALPPGSPPSRGPRL